MALRKQPSKSIDVEAIRHTDTRLNIPTEELRDFVAPAEAAPDVLRYPRDPSLDPQLVWKGKDEQDSADLEVPVVPIYIQEKIHPRALIDDLPRAARAGSPQIDFFADFSGPEEDFGQRIEFYQHEQPWSNRLILGDSLLVMTSLAEQEGLKGKVQTIYFDPPYGIKFGSNWQVSTRKRDVADGKMADLTRQPEQVRAFRDTWEKGVHSYLAYLRDRLTVANDLLTDSGSIFVQIGDANVHLVRCILDEVFGSENFVTQITYSKTSGATAVLLPGTSDYILWYAKDREQAKYRRLYATKALGGQGASTYNQLEQPDGERRPMTPEERGNPTVLSRGTHPYRLDNLTSQSMGREKGEGAASWFPVNVDGREIRPNMRSRWKTNEQGMAKLIAARRVQVTGDTLSYVRFLDDFPAFPITNTWMDIGGIQSRADPKIYVVQTATAAVERCLLMTTDPGDLVLDPTCGSGTTAYLPEQWGRRWITIDTSRVALALARTRLMAAKYPYYYLADSPEGLAKEAEVLGQAAPSFATQHDIKKGFVFRKVRHITLESIAKNPNVREGMTREEIDAAIARHAEFETLYDQPYEDTKRVRVSGPFTVESLSPHRVLATADENFDGAVSPEESARQGDFATMILDNLRKAGVQNGYKGERLSFDHLEPYAGSWLNAAGEYTDAEGQVRRVAVSLGPEHGTVTSHQVKEAAKEAVRGIGFDVLIVAGFAFDAHVLEETKQYGKLTVLPTRMNPDLAMGDELLKRTGAGNLFMVFGEPDIEISRTDDHQIVVKIHGVDVYDPTTGEIRSASTGDIACWFIDTNYNDESFFVRHAYFTSAEEPYKRLQRALRAEIDEDAWASLYRTESRPFPVPESGKIAVKVINHYGDEVMKVYAVS